MIQIQSNKQIAGLFILEQQEKTPPKIHSWYSSYFQAW